LSDSRQLLPLPSVELPSSQILYHVSRLAYAGGDLYFGCKGNRYDDPHGRFGVLYLAFDLATALMESMFHGHQWSVDARVIEPVSVGERLVREVALLEPLTVLNLNAPGAMAGRFGLNLHQLTSRAYGHTQRVAALAHAHGGIDGILYPSRNNYPGACLALFDRCRDKLGLIEDIPLERHRRWPAFVDDYAIEIRQL
jgi:hypothetical protein